MAITPTEPGLLEIRIEARRGNVVVKIEWPVVAAAECAAWLPRTDIHHEPGSTICHCGCMLTRIGEDVAEKLDYAPGTISVERHIRGKWVCDHCETLTQAPVPAQVIDKGLPTAGMLAHVAVSKFADHLPITRARLPQRR